VANSSTLSSAEKVCLKHLHDYAFPCTYCQRIRSAWSVSQPIEVVAVSRIPNNEPYCLELIMWYKSCLITQTCKPPPTYLPEE